MANPQVETVSTGADKAKLVAAALFVVLALTAFYLLTKEGALAQWGAPVHYTHLRAHETSLHLVC